LLQYRAKYKFSTIAPTEAQQRQTKRTCAKENVIMVDELVLSQQDQPQSVLVKELLKLINIWRRYGHKFGGMFFMDHGRVCDVLFVHGWNLDQKDNIAVFPVL